MAQSIGGTPFGGFHASDNFSGLTKSRPVETVSSPAVRTGVSYPGSQPVLAEANAIVGPIITPLQEPNSTRSGVIEAWPHRTQPAAVPSFVQKNDLKPSRSELSIAPSTESQFGSIAPAPAAAPDETAVPSLLPPGP